MADQKPTEAGKARADAIHAEIDRLKGAGAAPRQADQPGEQAKLTPRDFVDQWMAENDKKPSDK
jgi:hypothetical protein